MPDRRLSLRRETLAELRREDLSRVAAAAPASLPLAVACLDLSWLLCPQSWHTEEC